MDTGRQVPRFARLRPAHPPAGGRRTSDLVFALRAGGSHPPEYKKIIQPFGWMMVEEGGFEPPKSVTTDLQSAPFGRSGTPPYIHLELVDGFEPPTC